MSESVPNSMNSIVPKQQGTKRTRDHDAEDGLPSSTTAPLLLPDEIMARVFSYLVTPDFPVAALVCKTWASIVKKGLDGIIVVHGDEKENMMVYSAKKNRWESLPKESALATNGSEPQMVRQGRHIYAVKRNSGEEGCSTMRYDPYTGDQLNLNFPPLKILGPLCLTAVGTSLFLLSFDGTLWTNDLTQTKLEWKMGPQLPYLDRRVQGAAASLGGFVYVVGGRNGTRRMTGSVSVERYDPVSQLWEQIAPMNLRRYSTRVCTVGDFLYVVGGLREYKDNSAAPELSIEKYAPRENTWEIVTTMPTPRTHFCVAVVGQSIYVVGGISQGLLGDDYHNHKRMNLVEVFDTKSKIWTTGSAMPDTACFVYSTQCASFARFD